MKTLFVASYFPPIAGGSAVVYENLCRQLGNRAAVVAPWRHYVDGAEIPGWRLADESQPFAVRRLELLRPQLHPPSPNLIVSAWRLLIEDWPLRKRISRQLLKIVDDFSPDVVVLGELHSLAWVGDFLRARRGLTIVHYIHGEEITTNNARRLHARGPLDSLRRAEGVIAVSSFTRDELLRRGVRPERVHLVPNGVDLGRFTPGPRDPEILARHGLSDRKVLLTIARVEERKGHDRVIEALPSIAEQVPEVAYLVVGTGGYVEYLRELARRRGVYDRIVFAGLVPSDELIRYYRSCDVFVMPNRTLANGDTEGFGLVFLEANACGKPVIGGRAGGAVDAIEDGTSGYLVDGESHEEVSAAALRLLTNPALAERLGRQSLERAQRFSWKNQTETFIAACQACQPEKKRAL